MSDDLNLAQHGGYGAAGLLLLSKVLRIVIDGSITLAVGRRQLSAARDESGGEAHSGT